MKRSRSPGTSSSEPRKSARLELKLHSGSLAKQYAYRNTSTDPLFFGDAHELCKAYNRFLPFAQGLNAASARLSLYQSGKDFAAGVRKINAIAEDACRRIERLMRPLERSMNGFAGATISGLRWYETGDLFCT
jgi:hypothetical protein